MRSPGALTHFLIVSDRIQGTHRMREYSELMAAGEDSVTAARHAFGDLGKLQQGLSEYVMQKKFMYFMMPTELAEKDRPIAMMPVSAASADAVRADLMLHTGRRSEAKSLLEAVLRAEPDNQLAHEAMGSLEYRAGNLAGAKKWLAEAVGLNANDYLARFFYAVTLMRG